MADTKRRQRLADQIKQIVSEAIQRKIKDPKIGFVTITDVEITRDLRLAKIYYSIMGDNLSKKEGNRVIAKSKGFLKKILASQLSIRRIPELEFIIDTSLEHSMKMSALFDRISRENEDKRNDEE